MKCQHGNTVKVIVECVSSVCWDDGIVEVNRHGKAAEYSVWKKERQAKGLPHAITSYWATFSYLPISGCPKCKAIKMG